jgi:hypothetical protein
MPAILLIDSLPESDDWLIVTFLDSIICCTSPSGPTGCQSHGLLPGAFLAGQLIAHALPGLNADLALLVLMLPGVLKTVLRPIVHIAGLLIHGLPQLRRSNR